MKPLALLVGCVALIAWEYTALAQPLMNPAGYTPPINTNPTNLSPSFQPSLTPSPYFSVPSGPTVNTNQPSRSGSSENNSPPTRTETPKSQVPERAVSLEIPHAPMNADENAKTPEAASFSWWIPICIGLFAILVYREMRRAKA